MQTYELTLSSEVFKTFRCTKAANSLDIDQEKKAVHTFRVSADITSPYNIGLIVGASGSGKTTFAKHLFGNEVFREVLDLSKPVIEQFPASYSYDDCAQALCSVGLTAVPCWIRPAFTLSNGQRARAECALQMALGTEDGVCVIDEWTSVVDRTVAKVMSHCIQKHARKYNKRIILLSCHYDVIDWLNPCWVIDANNQEFLDRRLLCQSFKRTEQLTFEIKECPRTAWRNFSKYHYLSDKLPGGHIKTYGLYHDGNQIGFQCFANYVPHRSKAHKLQMHSNRTVVHPDYAGLGLGIKLINATSQIMYDNGYDVRAKYSSTPVYLAMRKYPEWRLLQVERDVAKEFLTGTMLRSSGFRKDVKTYSFIFKPA